MVKSLSVSVVKETPETSFPYASGDYFRAFFNFSVDATKLQIIFNIYNLFSFLKFY